MSFDFYFAGSQCQETTDLLCNKNANILKSFINDKKEIIKWFSRKKNGWTGKLLIDSGAFTVHRKGGKIDVDSYIKWLNDNDTYIDYAIQVDDIPGVWGAPKTQQDILESPEKSWNNYLYMYDRLSSPKKLLPVFHQGENFNWLVTILKSNKPDYICISGNKELTNKQREFWYNKCYNIINKINPNIKVHCLGSATLSNVEKFPFTSMDATSWIMTGANGNILTDYGTIYVGDDCKSLTLPEKEKLSKYLNNFNITLNQVGCNYKYRMLANIMYLIEKSATTECKAYNTIKERSLF